MCYFYIQWLISEAIICKSWWQHGNDTYSGRSQRQLSVRVDNRVAMVHIVANLRGIYISARGWQWYIQWPISEVTICKRMAMIHTVADLRGDTARGWQWYIVANLRGDYLQEDGTDTYSGQSQRQLSVRETPNWVNPVCRKMDAIITLPTLHLMFHDNGSVIRILMAKSTGPRRSAADGIAS